MNIKEKIQECVSVPGVSAAENQIADYLVKELCKLNIDAEIDPVGNVFGKIKSRKKDAKTILLEAHMDQIGLMVSGIDDYGYISFANIGGVDERILCGMDVEILSGRHIPGVVGSYAKKDEEINPKIDELRIDIGYAKEKAKKLVKIGDKILIKGNFAELLNSFISGCALDNRAGIISVLECLRNIDIDNIPYNVNILFTTQEELGLHGAILGTKKADAAIVVDVTHGTTPDTKEETGVFPLGSGAIICRGPNLHYEYSKQLIKLAINNSIPYEIEVASGPSGTTAWAIQVAEHGIPVMLVSIPLRYMHTNVETADINDITAVSELLFSAISGGLNIE